MRKTLLLGGILVVGSVCGAMTIDGPSPYDAPVEYISSAGAYFDTGVKLTSDMTVKIVFDFPSVPSGLTAVFGVRNKSEVRNISVGLSGDVSKADGLFCDFNNCGNSSEVSKYRVTAAKNGLLCDTDYVVELTATQRVVSCRDYAITNAVPCSEYFVSDGSAYVFWIHQTSATALSWPKAQVRVRSLVISRENQVLYDYVPCRVGDQPQLYERINGTFSEIVGDPSKLVAGPDIRDAQPTSVVVADRSAVIGVRVADVADPISLYGLYASVPWSAMNPETYFAETNSITDEKLSGKGLSVDLGFGLTQDMTVDIVFSIESENWEEYGHGIFGNRESSSKNNISIQYTKASSGGIILDFSNGGTGNESRYRATYAGKVKTIYRAHLSKNRRAVFDVDGILLAENTNFCPDTIVTPNARLFDFGSSFRQCPIRIYRVSIRENDRCIHDYLPVATVSGSGLWDCVSQVMVADAEKPGFCVGSAVPRIEKLGDKIDKVGVSLLEIPRRHLEPETEYWYALLAIGETSGAYSTWGVEFPRSFRTKPLKGGLLVVFR